LVILACAEEKRTAFAERRYKSCGTSARPSGAQSQTCQMLYELRTARPHLGRNESGALAPRSKTSRRILHRRDPKAQGEVGRAVHCAPGWSSSPGLFGLNLVFRALTSTATRQMRAVLPARAPPGRSATCAPDGGQPGGSISTSTNFGAQWTARPTFHPIHFAQSCRVGLRHDR